MEQKIVTDIELVWRYHIEKKAILIWYEIVRNNFLVYKKNKLCQWTTYEN